MAVTGETELIANLTKPEKTERKKVRKATRDDAKVFQEKLKEVTPVAKSGNYPNMTPLAEHTKHGNLKTNDGNYSMDVGYDKGKSWIAHFPNAGTSKQYPQHFIEKARAQSKKEILAKYIEDLKVWKLQRCK